MNESEIHVPKSLIIVIVTVLICLVTYMVVDIYFSEQAINAPVEISGQDKSPKIHVEFNGKYARFEITSTLGNFNCYVPSWYDEQDKYLLSINEETFYARKFPYLKKKKYCRYRLMYKGEGVKILSIER